MQVFFVEYNKKGYFFNSFGFKIIFSLNACIILHIMIDLKSNVMTLLKYTWGTRLKLYINR